jgi:hypothetical protein
MRSSAVIRVSAVQPLAGGVTVYAIDLDGRRIVIGASPHGVSLLDRYQYSNRQPAAGEGADLPRA